MIQGRALEKSAEVSVSWLFQFAPISSTTLPVPATVLWGFGFTANPEASSCQFMNYFHGYLKMLKPNIQLHRSAFTKKLYKWGKFLPQRTASIRQEEDYLHKKNLEMFLLKTGVRREGRLPCSFHTCSWKPITNVDKPPFVKQVTITLPSS